MRQDDDYFGSVYREYYPDIYRFAFSYVKRKEVAEDIAQDIFFEFYLHAPKDKRNIKSFLLKTTRNRCLDLIRKEKRTKEVQRQYETMRIEDGKRAELSENEDIIFLSLSKIPKKYQEPIRFFYYGNMTVKEIALLLLISEEAVRKRLQRGREYLKTLLEGEKENDNR